MHKMSLPDNFGSPSHLYIRQKKEESDINLLDEHDSFYMTTKSLLVLFQIMGVMPIMRTPKGTEGPRTSFNWFSPACYWAFFIYACETIVVIWGKKSTRHTNAFSIDFVIISHERTQLHEHAS